jgi:hypothetical protein
MNETRKVVAGEPLSIPANTWNKLIDLVEPGSRPGAGYYSTDFCQSATKILVKNDTGVAQERFNILAITEPFISPSDELTEFQSRVTFKGKIPANGDIYGNYDRNICALLEPLEANAIGLAAVTGVVPVQVNFSSDHKWADTTNGNTQYLTSKLAGPYQVLWKESGTGIKWAYVHLQFWKHLRVINNTLSANFELVQRLRISSGLGVQFVQNDFWGTEVAIYAIPTSTSSSWMGF